MRHIFREAWSGIRRNATMTVAVIMTMWVSLALFGVGLLAAEQVDLTKGKWYDKIEISVFLCVKTSSATNCTQGEDATDAEKAEIKAKLEANPEVAEVMYESKADMFEDFRKFYADQPILATMTVDDMQDSFRVKLKNPEEFSGVYSAMANQKGVEAVQDLRKYLEDIFSWLNMARWGTISASVVLLLAAALQIGNTIRMAAFNRRRELGIMRLVGASNWYIMLPFLLESLIAAALGAGLAFGTLMALEKFVIQDKAKVEIPGEWIDYSHVLSAGVVLGLVAVVLSIVPTLVATRRFLRV
ncbi:MAG: permease-like cell division protein FtsX [Propionibacteriaceae bacterium]|jgi:cell division transport system permease protein|nr:permease-like cell division protein FtsX [Propionibacteriaceae bacterium]